MSNVEIKLNSAGIAELLKSSEVASYTEEIANTVKGRCNGNYNVTQQTGKYRTHTRITSADNDTFWRNLNGNDLLKALH